MQSTENFLWKFYYDSIFRFARNFLWTLLLLEFLLEISLVFSRTSQEMLSGPSEDSRSSFQKFLFRITTELSSEDFSRNSSELLEKSQDEKTSNL